MPYCGRAEEVIRELFANFGDDLRYVRRYLPLNDVHAHTQLAAETAAAAAALSRPVREALPADRARLARRSACTLGLVGIGNRSAI